MSTNIRVRVAVTQFFFNCYLTGSITLYNVFFFNGYYQIVLLFIKIVRKKILYYYLFDLIVTTRGRF